jgi:hypothetical protein
MVLYPGDCLSDYDVIGVTGWHRIATLVGRQPRRAASAPRQGLNALAGGGFTGVGPVDQDARRDGIWYCLRERIGQAIQSNRLEQKCRVKPPYCLAASRARCADHIAR